MKTSVPPSEIKDLLRMLTRAQAGDAETAAQYGAYWDERAHQARIDKFLGRSFTAPDPPVPTFRLTPGQPGFNREATERMRGLLDPVADQVTCTSRKCQPYQKVLRYLTDPVRSPVTSLLVAHRTGSGKTRSMLLVLDNYYADPRPKLVVFPNQVVLNNFYLELLAWDTRYRTYVMDRLAGRALPTDAKERVAVVQAILAMTGHPQKAGQEGYLAAPLRAYTYQEVAGRALEGSGFLKRTFAEAAWDTCATLAGGRPNVFCNKVVVMDEAHNLIKPDAAVLVNPASRANLAHLAQALYEAKNTVRMLFTATPVVDDPADAAALLRVVKGAAGAAVGDEGFVSAFYASPPSAYPVVTPPDRLMPATVEVVLEGDPADVSSALGNYISRCFDFTRKAPPTLNKTFLQTASRVEYEYVSKHYNVQSRAEFLTRLRTDPRLVAPKLYAAAKLIQQSKGKVVVLTARRHGFFSLGYLIERCPEFADLAGGRVRTLLGRDATPRADLQTHPCDGRALPPGDAQTECVKTQFNLGEDIRALLLNADVFSEGIDFKGVRDVVLLDVPPSWGKLLQRIGRAVRNCSHAALPEDERTVHTHLLVATLPDSVVVGKHTLDLRDIQTVDEADLARLITTRDAIEAEMCRLIGSSVDYQTLHPFTGTDSCPMSDVAAPDPVDEVAARAAATSAARALCDTTLAKCQRAALRVGVATQTDVRRVFSKCTDEHGTCTVAAGTPLENSQ